jgi:hypothetical protein
MGDCRSAEIEAGKAEGDELRIQTPGGGYRYAGIMEPKRARMCSWRFLRSFWKRRESISVGIGRASHASNWILLTKC